MARAEARRNYGAAPSAEKPAAAKGDKPKPRPKPSPGAGAKPRPKPPARGEKPSADEKALRRLQKQIFNIVRAAPDGEMPLSKTLEEYKRAWGRDLDWKAHSAEQGQGRFRDFIASVRGLQVGPPTAKGGGERVWVREKGAPPAAKDARPPREEALGRRPPQAPGRAWTPAVTKRVVARCRAIVAKRPDWYHGISRFQFISRLGGRFGALHGDDMALIKKEYGNFDDFTSAHIIEIMKGPADAPPPPPAEPRAEPKAEPRRAKRDKARGDRRAFERFMDDLGLGAYFDTLAAAEVTSLEVLALLEEEDLREIQLPIGPRRKLATAIAGLRADLPRGVLRGMLKE